MATPITPDTISKTVISVRADITVAAAADLKTAIGNAFDSYVVPAGKQVNLTIILDGQEVTI